MHLHIETSMCVYYFVKISQTGVQKVPMYSKEVQIGVYFEYIGTTVLAIPLGMQHATDGNICIRIPNFIFIFHAQKFN